MDKIYPDLFLIRHGETEWNAKGKMQGHLDSPLTEKGRAQAQALAPLIRNLPARRIVSPLGRALETARLIFGSEDFEVDGRLAEIDVGQFAGHTLSRLLISYPTVFTGGRLDWYDRTPEGENFADLMVRCQQLLSELDGPTILVTHGITLRMLRLIAMKRPISELDEIPTVQGAVHVVRRSHHEIWQP